jgi:hypothetical protein
MAIMKFGKHNGAPYERFAAEYRKYCAWVLREDRQSSQLNRTMKSFAVYLKKQHGGLMMVGKHSGKWFDELIKEEPEYAVWVQSLDQPSAAVKDFADYIIEQQRIEADDESRIRARDEEADGKCITCIVRARTSAFVPCGHCVCCWECASTLGNNRCPICRKQATVQRLFVG